MERIFAVVALAACAALAWTCSRLVLMAAFAAAALVVGVAIH